MLKPLPLVSAVGLCALLLCAHPAAARPISAVEFAFPSSYGFVNFSSLPGGTASLDLILEEKFDDTAISGPAGTYVITSGHLHAQGFRFDSGQREFGLGGSLESFQYNYKGAMDWSGGFDMRLPDGSAHSASFTATISALSVIGNAFDGALLFDVHQARFDSDTASLLGLPNASFAGRQYVYLDFNNQDAFEDAREGRTFGYVSLTAPEPTTWMLAAVGFGAVARRRRRQS